MKEDPKTVIPVLIQVLKNENEDEEVRIFAAHSLGRFGGEARLAIPHLLQCLQGKSPRVGHWAAIALGDIGPVEESVVPGLIDALKNENLILGVCMALGKIGQSARAAVPALLEIAKTSNFKYPTGISARSCAISTLGDIGAPAASTVPLLLEILKNPKVEMELRISAAYALRGIRPLTNDILSALREAARTNDQLGQTASQSLRKIDAEK
jgi:HEAT repeat protein